MSKSKLELNGWYRSGHEIRDAKTSQLIATAFTYNNANIIASVPELLKTLKECRRELLQNSSANEPGGAMDKALIKAVCHADKIIAQVEGGFDE